MNPLTPYLLIISVNDPLVAIRALLPYFIALDECVHLLFINEQDPPGNDFGELIVAGDMNLRRLRQVAKLVQGNPYVSEVNSFTCGSKNPVNVKRKK